MWSNDGCKGWWLLVAKVTQQRWLRWMMVVVEERFVWKQSSASFTFHKLMVNV